MITWTGEYTIVDGERFPVQNVTVGQAGINIQREPRVLFGYPLIETQILGDSPILQQVNDAEDKAEALFARSLPEQYAQYQHMGYIEIPSKLFPKYKYAVDFNILLYPSNVSTQRQHGWHLGHLGTVCVTLDKSVDPIPLWDRRLQLCLMLLYQEAYILKVGNWIDNTWAMAGGFRAYEYMKANGNVYEKETLKKRPGFRFWI